MIEIALIACGAVAREVLVIRARQRWDADVQVVPSVLHNEPDRIPAAMLSRIREARARHGRAIVVYGGCSTGGQLDAMLQWEGPRRVAGPHCHEMCAGGRHEPLMLEIPGTYFLTDYLVQSFDHLVIEGLGLSRFRQLRREYFSNYTRVVYLAQQNEASLWAKPAWAAQMLGLPLGIIHVGNGLPEARLLESTKDDNSAGGVLEGHPRASEGSGRS